MGQFKILNYLNTYFTGGIMNMEVIGYSERGVINSLIYNIFYSENNLEKIKRFLSMICLPNLENIENNIIISDFSNINNAKILIEQSFSDFGDCDIVILVEKNINSETVKQAIFIEAKVKTDSIKSWSIEKEYKEFDKFREKKENGVKVYDSTLFSQLYSKIMLVESIKQGISEKTCNEGFWAKRGKPRKIGENKVVRKAFEKIKEYCENDDNLFITIFPDNIKNMIKFFENNNQWWPLCEKSHCIERFNSNYSQRCGFIPWESIMGFCRQNDLTDAINVLEFNEGQIY
jgi:hypothetical protein